MATGERRPSIFVPETVQWRREQMRASVLHFYLDAATQTYFFTTDHSQRASSVVPLPAGVVAVTVTLPRAITPRPLCPSGVVEDSATYFRVFYPGYREVWNPAQGLQDIWGA